MSDLRRKRAEVRVLLAARYTLLVVAIICAPGAASVAAPFYMGADISLETFMQQQIPGTTQPNAQFYDNGVQAPLDTILYDHGANLFRLRIFVNPQTSYTDTNSGAIQTTAYDIALAQQIKAHCPNAKLLLDFMYSDTWADPGRQGKPAAWSTLTPISQLQTQIQTYTQSTLQAFNAAGVLPNMVSVGNEIANGMLWQTTSNPVNPVGGKLIYTNSSTEQTSWQNLGLLLNSAIAGVRAEQAADNTPKIDVAIHVDQGDWNGHPQYYFGPDASHGNINRMTDPAWANVSDFDVIGLSYYPSTRADHSLSLLQSNLNAVANKNPSKKIMIMETNYPWETSSLAVPQWAATPAGQQQFMTDLQNAVLGLHGGDGTGEGIIYWYPEAVPVSGYTIYNGGATALFDSNHNPLPALNTFGITLTPGDYDHNGIVDAADYAIWRETFGSTTDLRADGDHSGTVDQGDYDTWKSNFGNIHGSGAGANSAVPEPESLVMLVAGTLTFCIRRILRTLFLPPWCRDVA